MTKTRYIALLRGINVGGKNKIKMTDLKACFESLDFEEVLTYIQSGNILFTAQTESVSVLTLKIERALSKRFKYQALVIVLTSKQLTKAIKQAPKNFGKSSDLYRYDVLFLKKPLKPKTLALKIKTKEGVDTIYAGEEAIYFSRLISKATQSQLAKIIQLPEYKLLSIRNWNTTSKLFELLQT